MSTGLLSRPWLRWTLVIVVLAVAMTVALWPRDDGGGGGKTAEPASTSDTGPVLPEIGAMRAAAALEPCPVAAPATTGSGPLAGVRVPCLDGSGSVDLGAALAGRAALLNLWGPQCQPCVKEMPALQSYAREPGAVLVVGVQSQDLPDQAALDLMSKLDVHYPSVTDPDKRLRTALDAPPVLPMSFIVHPDGRVEPVVPPTVLETPEQVRGVVDGYLG
jgi:thiol-disulfide isomerase/thioredoxin